MDLVTSLHVGVFTTIGHDGYPQSSAVAYVYDDGVFRFTVTSAKQKVKNLRRNSNCSFVVFDPLTATPSIELRGTAEVVPDDDLRWGKQVAATQGSDEEALRKHTPAGETRLCIAFKPVKSSVWPPAPHYHYR